MILHNFRLPEAKHQGVSDHKVGDGVVHFLLKSVSFAVPSHPFVVEVLHACSEHWLCVQVLAYPSPLLLLIVFNHFVLRRAFALVLPHNNLSKRRTQTGGRLWHTAPIQRNGKCQSATSGIPGQRTLGILPPQTLRVLKDNCNDSSGPLRPQKTLVTAAGEFVHCTDWCRVEQRSYSTGYKCRAQIMAMVWG